MSESKPNTTTSRENNMRVYAIGALIALLAAVLIACTEFVLG